MEKAAQLLDQPVDPVNPLQARWVIQPGRLWEQALRRKLADRGIATGLTFGSLRLTLERAFRLVCPKARLLTEDQLFWDVLNLLHKHSRNLKAIGLTEGTPPRQWLDANHVDPSLARIQLARMLTSILDDHATYRPDKVMQWVNGTHSNAGDETWIAGMTKALWSDSVLARPLTLHLPAFVEQLKNSTAIIPGFPSRIVAVLTGAQPCA
ncbi:MAG: exodeoxyribonuclease V subunit gamma, partial [bacterium]